MRGFGRIFAPFVSFCLLVGMGFQAAAAQDGSPEDALKTLYQLLDKGALEEAYAIAAYPAARGEEVMTMMRQEALVKAELAAAADHLKKNGGLKKLTVLWAKIRKPGEFAAVRLEIETRKAEGKKIQSYEMTYRDGKWRAFIILPSR